MLHGCRFRRAERVRDAHARLERVISLPPATLPLPRYAAASAALLSVRTADTLLYHAGASARCRARAFIISPIFRCRRSDIFARFSACPTIFFYATPPPTSRRCRAACAERRQRRYGYDHRARHTLRARRRCRRYADAADGDAAPPMSLRLLLPAAAAAGC